MGFGSGIRNPESGIQKKLIPDPGSRGQQSTGSRILKTVFKLPVILNQASTENFFSNFGLNFQYVSPLDPWI
jgi:hypothetical protein